MSTPGTVTIHDSTGNEEESWNATIGPGELSLVLVAAGEAIPLKTIGESMKALAGIIEATGRDMGIPCTAYLSGMGFDDDHTVRIKAMVGPKAKRKRRPAMPLPAARETARPVGGTR